MKVDGIGSAAFVLAFASLLSRLLGVLRDRWLAGAFGAGVSLDAYYAAFRLPDLLYNLFILGALTSGFVPVFSEYLERRGKEEAFKLAGQVLSFIGAVMAIASLALCIGARWIVPLITPGFHGEALTQTITLSRIMFFSPFVLGLSTVLGGILQARKRFVAFAFAPVLYNVGILAGILWLVPRFGIVGVAWGVVIGATLHFLAQASVAFRVWNIPLSWPSWKPDGVRRILKLMIPRTASLAVTQLNLVALLAIASLLESGSVAVFNLANNLQSFPVGILGISYALAAFPSLTASAGNGDHTEFGRILSRTLRQIVFWTLPATGLFILLRHEIVNVLLGDGRFGGVDAMRTATVLGWFTLSLVFQALAPLLSRAFFALQDSWTPFWIGLVAEATNITLSLVLHQEMGISGLAVAFSASSAVQFVLLAWWLVRAHPEAFDETLTVSLTKTFLASLALLLCAWFVGHLVPIGAGFWMGVERIVLIGGVGGLAFACAAWVQGSEELFLLIGRVKRFIV